MNIESNSQNLEAMVTSTGSLGLERRSYDRLYWNWRGAPVRDVDHLVSGLSRMASIAEHEGRTRTVFRGLFTKSAYKDLEMRHKDLPEGTEAEVSLKIDSTWREDPYWLIVLGTNAPTRQAVMSSRDFTQELSYRVIPNYAQSEDDKISIKKSLDSMLRRGYVVHSQIEDSMAESLLGLWSGAFEWTESGIHDLQQRLQAQRNLPPHLRQVWFTGVEHDGKFVTAATAERIDFRRERNPIMLVENTEWFTDPQYRKKGLMSGAVTNLNSQILNDLGPEAVIYAECNWMTRAFGVGRSAGMIMPETFPWNSTAQVLRQNVAVGDGLEPSGLRDFVFMYLPRKEIFRSYRGKEVSEVVRKTK